MSTLIKGLIYNVDDVQKHADVRYAEMDWNRNFNPTFQVDASTVAYTDEIVFTSAQGGDNPHFLNITSPAEGFDLSKLNIKILKISIVGLSYENNEFVIASDTDVGEYVINFSYTYESDSGTLTRHFPFELTAEGEKNVVNANHIVSYIGVNELPHTSILQNYEIIPGHTAEVQIMGLDTLFYIKDSNSINCEKIAAHGIVPVKINTTTTRPYMEFHTLNNPETYITNEIYYTIINYKNHEFEFSFDGPTSQEEMELKVGESESFTTNTIPVSEMYESEGTALMMNVDSMNVDSNTGRGSVQIKDFMVVLNSCRCKVNDEIVNTFICAQVRSKTEISIPIKYIGSRSIVMNLSELEEDIIITNDDLTDPETSDSYTRYPETANENVKPATFWFSGAKIRLSRGLITGWYLNDYNNYTGYTWQSQDRLVSADKLVIPEHISSSSDVLVSKSKTINFTMIECPYESSGMYIVDKAGQQIGAIEGGYHVSNFYDERPLQSKSLFVNGDLVIQVYDKNHKLKNVSISEIENTMIKQSDLNNDTYEMNINKAIMKRLEVKNDNLDFIVNNNNVSLTSNQSRGYVHTHTGTFTYLPISFQSLYPDASDGCWMCILAGGQSITDCNAGMILFRYNSSGNDINMITIGTQGEHSALLQVLGNGQTRLRYYTLPTSGTDSMKLLYENRYFSNGNELAYTIQDRRANFKLLYKRMNDMNIGQIGFYNKSAQIYFNDTGTPSNDYLSIWFAADGTEQYKFYNDRAEFNQDLIINEGLLDVLCSVVDKVYQKLEYNSTLDNNEYIRLQFNDDTKQGIIDFTKDTQYYKLKLGIDGAAGCLTVNETGIEMDGDVDINNDLTLWQDLWVKDINEAYSGENINLHNLTAIHLTTNNADNRALNIIDPYLTGGNSVSINMGIDDGTTAERSGYIKFMNYSTISGNHFAIGLSGQNSSLSIYKNYLNVSKQINITSTNYTSYPINIRPSDLNNSQGYYVRFWDASSAAHHGFYKDSNGDYCARTELENGTASVDVYSNKTVINEDLNVNGKLDTPNKSTAASALGSDLQKAIIDLVYPIGSIYTSMDLTSPQTKFGFGTWTAINNKFLFCLDQSNGFTDPTDNTSKTASNQTGGEAKHTLIPNEMPSHTHTGGLLIDKDVYSSHTPISSGNLDCVNHGFSWNRAWISGSGINIGYTGGNQSHNNMPPFMTVYAWQRTT